MQIGQRTSITLLLAYIPFTQPISITLMYSNRARSVHILDGYRRRTGDLPPATGPVLVRNSEPDGKLQEAKPMFPMKILVLQQGLPTGLEQYTVEAAQLRSVFVPKLGKLSALSPVPRIVMPGMLDRSLPSQMLCDLRPAVL